MISVAHLLQQQRTAYVQTLPGRLAQLTSLASQLEDPAQAAAALPALERCAHSLAGTAGTFGFAAMGRTARELELLVEEAQAGHAAARPLAARLAALRRELEAAMRSAQQPEGAQ